MLLGGRKPDTPKTAAPAGSETLSYTSEHKQELTVHAGELMTSEVIELDFKDGPTIQVPVKGSEAPLPPVAPSLEENQPVSAGQRPL
jgi:hypothetical protein